MATKNIKLICSNSGLTNFFTSGNMYKAKQYDCGKVLIQDRISLEWFLATIKNDNIFIFGEANGVSASAQFTLVNTKTIKCTKVNHHLEGTKTFKQDKRYQVLSGRPCGAVAGKVFDEDGVPWNLYREDVGYSCATALFEAKYS